MRTNRTGVLLSLAVVLTAGVCWYTTTRRVRPASEQVRVLNPITARPDLNAEIERYRAAGDDRRARCAVADDFATSRTDVWDACGRKIGDVEGSKRIALAHFASAYSKRGRRQKDELVALLHSPDIQLVLGLLTLLNYTVDLGPTGEWQMEESLEGAEVAGHVAAVYSVHPTLAPAVATTLGVYGPAAKGTTDTLLRIALSHDRFAVFTAKIALREIDIEGVYSQFDLDPLDAPLTDIQRAAIQKHLGGELAFPPNRGHSFAVGLDARPLTLGRGDVPA